jgi:protein-S-isoprenylcysteine O-methyltransferase Ste14
MTTHSWVNAALRSIVWLGAVVWLAYLKKPDGGSVLAVRADAIGWLGAGLLVAGVAFHIWSNVSLARGEDAAGSAPTQLVVVGPYRYVRNPIYLAGVPLLLGTYLLYSAWRRVDAVAAVVVLAFFHLLVVHSDEPALRRRFGLAYEDYCRRVPRWIPRLAAVNLRNASH